jgi:hypothetical protein
MGYSETTPERMISLMPDLLALVSMGITSLPFRIAGKRAEPSVAAPDELG